jgi:hypothetical protein
VFDTKSNGYLKKKSPAAQAVSPRFRKRCTGSTALRDTGAGAGTRKPSDKGDGYETTHDMSAVAHMLRSGKFTIDMLCDFVGCPGSQPQGEPEGRRRRGR